MLAVALATMILAVMLVAAERWWRPARVPLKLAASTGFVVVAVMGRATEQDYGIWILVGLILAWVGDAALLGSDRAWFLFGLVAFLQAHVAYLIGFLVRGWEAAWGIPTAGVLVIAAAAVGRWLWPHVGDDMRPAVATYIVVISAMVAGAAGTAGFEPDARILGGALLFYLSDLAVARDRFVSPGWINRVWGLPAYYAGQLLLAWAAGG